MDCETCREKRKQAEPVPYIVYESDMARMERIIKRLVAIIVLLALIVAGMFWYETQWVDVETTVTQENDNGLNNYIGNDGDIINGTTDSKTENQNP